MSWLPVGAGVQLEQLPWPRTHSWGAVRTAAVLLLLGVAVMVGMVAAAVLLMLAFEVTR